MNDLKKAFAWGLGITGGYIALTIAIPIAILLICLTCAICGSLGNVPKQ